MHMPLETSVLVLSLDDRIWLDSDSLIAYLREIERQAQAHYKVAETELDGPKAVAAYSTGDMVRQIADGLVLTTIAAAETIRGRRGSQR